VNGIVYNDFIAIVSSIANETDTDTDTLLELTQPMCVNMTVQ